MKFLKRVMIIVVLIMTFQSTGCSLDPIQDDLLNYINNELPKITELEKTVVEGYDSISGENFQTNDIAFRKLMNDILPASRKLVETCDKVNPKTKEVRELHKKLTSMYKLNRKAMQTVLAGLDRGDAEYIARSTKDFDESKKLEEEFKIDLKNLCKDHNVELLDEK